MFSSRILVLTACSVLLAGCAGLNNTEQRVLTGATIGAGAGAGLGAVTAGLSIPAGAAIGAAAGILGGFGVDALSKD
jgi:hypothetical protein